MLFPTTARYWNWVYLYERKLMHMSNMNTGGCVRSITVGGDGKTINILHKPIDAPPSARPDVAASQRTTARKKWPSGRSPSIEVLCGGPRRETPARSVPRERLTSPRPSNYGFFCLFSKNLKKIASPCKRFHHRKLVSPKVVSRILLAAFAHCRNCGSPYHEQRRSKTHRNAFHRRKRRYLRLYTLLNYFFIHCPRLIEQGDPV